MARMKTATQALLIALLCVTIFWVVMQIASAQPPSQGLQSSFLDRVFLSTSPRALPRFTSTPFSIRGYDPSIDNTSFETVWEGPTDQRPIPTAPVRLTLFSDDPDDSEFGTGARLVHVQCLDGNYDAFFEDVATNGLAGREMSADCLRVQIMAVLTSGTDFLANEGVLTFENASVVFETITVNDEGRGKGLSQSGVFTVPRGRVGYVEFVESDSAANTYDVQFLGGQGTGPRSVVEATVTGSLVFLINRCFNQEFDIEIQTRKASAGQGITVTAGARIILVDSASGECPEPGMDRPVL